MNVLIGVDDSPHSKAALEFVCRMPWPPASRFLVVSSAAIPAMLYSDKYQSVSTDFNAWLDELDKVHERLASSGAEKLSAKGLNAKGRVVRGDPRLCLLEEAAKEDVDLVVVGSHGRTGLGKLLMGSVASHVTTHAHCSVLVVKLQGDGR